MRVVLHVGALKTGTSLIQSYLRQSARRRARSGIAVVPRHHTSPLIGWGDVVIRRPDRLRRRIEAEARRRPHVLVLSHEAALGRPFERAASGMYPRARARIEALADVCRGFETDVVLYVRPIAAFVESAYLQTIHEGASHTFDTWFGDFPRARLAWSPLVDHLDEVFGRDAVHVGDFREIERGQSAFLRGFLQRSGIEPWTAVRFRHHANPSISAAGLELALERNPRLETPEDRRAWRTHLQLHHSNLDGSRARPMPQALRHVLEADSSAEYEKLARRAAESTREPAGGCARGRALSRRR